MTATARLRQAEVAKQKGLELAEGAGMNNMSCEKEVEAARRMALKDLDLAVMMGGPKLQKFAHKMIKELILDLASTGSSETASAQLTEGTLCQHT